MPGAVPNTSTIALSNQTLAYAIELAEKGLMALRDSPALRMGLNTHAGQLTYQAVGEAFGLPAVAPEVALELG